MLRCRADRKMPRNGSWSHSSLKLDSHLQDTKKSQIVWPVVASKAKLSIRIACLSHQDLQKKKRRNDSTFWHQCNEKPSIVAAAQDSEKRRLHLLATMHEEAKCYTKLPRCIKTYMWCCTGVPPIHNRTRVSTHTPQLLHSCS